MFTRSAASTGRTAYNLFFQKHVPLVARALRSRCGAALRRRRGLIPLDEDEGARHLADIFERESIEAVRSCFCIPIAIRSTRTGERNFPGGFRTFSSPLRTNYRRNIANSSVPRRSPPTPLSGRACSDYLGEIATHLKGRGIQRQLSSCSRPAGSSSSSEAQRQCIRMLESGPRPASSAPRRCATARPEERHRLRHGRHHREGRRHSQGGALTTGSALIGGYDGGLPIQVPMIDI